VNEGTTVARVKSMVTRGGDIGKGGRMYFWRKRVFAGLFTSSFASLEFLKKHNGHSKKRQATPSGPALGKPADQFAKALQSSFAIKKGGMNKQEKNSPAEKRETSQD